MKQMRGDIRMKRTLYLFMALITLFVFSSCKSATETITLSVTFADFTLEDGEYKVTMIAVRGRLGEANPIYDVVLFENRLFFASSEIMTQQTINDRLYNTSITYYRYETDIHISKEEFDHINRYHYNKYYDVQYNIFVIFEGKYGQIEVHSSRIVTQK